MAHILGRVRVLQLPRELRPPRRPLLFPLVFRVQDRFHPLAPATRVPRKCRHTDAFSSVVDVILILRAHKPPTRRF